MGYRMPNIDRIANEGCMTMRTANSITSPVAQGPFAANNAIRVRQEPGGHRRGENDVVVEVLENGLHVVRVPRRNPLPAEGNRIQRDQAVQSQTDMSPLGYCSHTSVALATTPLLLKKILAQLLQCVATCS